MRMRLSRQPRNSSVSLPLLSSRRSKRPSRRDLRRSVVRSSLEEIAKPIPVNVNGLLVDLGPVAVAPPPVDEQPQVQAKKGLASYTVQDGDGAIKAALALDPDNMKAMVAYLYVTKQVHQNEKTNRSDLREGDVLNGDLSRFSAEGLAQLSKLGGRIIAAEHKEDVRRDIVAMQKYFDRNDAELVAKINTAFAAAREDQRNRTASEKQEVIPEPDSFGDVAEKAAIRLGAKATFAYNAVVGGAKLWIGRDATENTDAMMEADAALNDVQFSKSNSFGKRVFANVLEFAPTAASSVNPVFVWRYAVDGVQQ